jgi:hypothetical protein
MKIVFFNHLFVKEYASLNEKETLKPAQAGNTEDIAQRRRDAERRKNHGWTRISIENASLSSLIRVNPCPSVVLLPVVRVFIRGFLFQEKKGWGFFLLITPVSLWFGYFCGLFTVSANASPP